MADLWPDDPMCEFGIVISPPDRVHTFDYYYGRNGDIWTQYRTGRLANLRDVTETWAGGTYDAAIREGFGQLAGGT